MEKRDKIIIAGLVIVILALVAGLAYMFMGNSLSVSDSSVPSGMQKYDFNSEFTMNVPDDVRFLKSWNNSEGGIFGQGYTYFDKNNELLVGYVNSPLVTHELIDSIAEIGNTSGNATYEFDGDLIISHNHNNGKVGNSADKSNFTESVALQKGHMFVAVSGNDLDLIKSMIKSIEFYE